MDIIQIYKKYPRELDCINRLIQIKWRWEPQCPYCRAIMYTKIIKENRFHCNNCNSSFSVTVNTIFHNSKIDLQKRFLAIYLILNSEERISARQLASKIEVNKDTSWRILKKIRQVLVQEKQMLKALIEDDIIQ